MSACLGRGRQALPPPQQLLGNSTAKPSPPLLPFRDQPGGRCYLSLWQPRPLIRRRCRSRPGGGRGRPLPSPLRAAAAARRRSFPSAQEVGLRRSGGARAVSTAASRPSAVSGPPARRTALPAPLPPSRPAAVHTRFLAALATRRPRPAEGAGPPPPS